VSYGWIVGNSEVVAIIAIFSAIPRRFEFARVAIA